MSTDQATTPATGPPAPPPTPRSRVVALARRNPLVVLALALQAVIALRLHNSAFQDEALYLATGHWLLQDRAGGPPLTSAPEGWFTGAPQLYPVLAALLDSAGGLGLVRTASTVLLLATTAAVAWSASSVMHLLGGALNSDSDDDGDGDGDDAGAGGTARAARRAAAGAALAVAATGPLLALGHFASMDAAAYACLAWALALGLHAVRRGGSRWAWWGAGAGALLGLAVLLKYTSGIAVPFVLLALVGAAPAVGRPRAVRVAAVAAGTGALVLLLSALTWGRGLVAGFVSSTLARQPVAPAPASELALEVLRDAGLPLLLAVAGAVVLFRHRPLLGAALGLGALAPAVLQVVTGEQVSLYKAPALGTVLGAVAAGVLVAAARAWWASALVVTALVVAVALGAGTASRLFGSWASSDPLRDVLVPLVEQRPGAGVAGDNPETMQYPLWEQVPSQRWGAFYPGAYQRDGLVDAAAYEAALSAGDFSVVFFDGSSATGRELEPQMPGLGFEQAAQVSSPEGGRTWTVWTSSR
ncbi:glycosyltransferase family 39 protein [Quadrisphaera sp. INWT6]|uniref:glycosyltransferase family 39 protein n=1 Tax=Quadrisphaera sp. INWT6 TaxID=2596917 RepID=UPI001892081A|nr:glycosyltransferase family 39 protein [Quadrisphaera sp. INWT6]MBF5080309.1 DUF2029 domain-containing protein [Quadrisphaera sp. INWT6]